MAPAVIGDHIGMTALNTGPLLSRMLVRKLVGKPDEEKALYRITQKGKDYRANPPKEPQGSVGKVVEKVSEKNDEKVSEKNGEKVGKKDYGEGGAKAIPSQSDISRL